MNTQIITPEGPPDICEGLVDNDLIEWLQQLNLSQDAINKIKTANNLSFKKIQTLSLHDRSLSKQIAEHLSLNIIDSLTFLAAIEDLRKQANDPNTILDSNYKQQQKIINDTFDELINELQERKSKTLHTLQKIYSHQRSALNNHESNTTNIDMKLIFAMQNKSEIVENIQCLGVINRINIKIPVIRIQNMSDITSNSITIAMNDIWHKLYEYEVHYGQLKQTAINGTYIQWQKQVINHCNYNHICITNLQPNTLYFIRIKKINTFNEQFVMSKVLEVNTVSDELETKEMETMNMNWDKLRHGKHVHFISNNCIETGAYSLGICDSMISISNSINNRYFLWEITVDQIAKESSFIGYIKGPLSKYDNNNICLTEGIRNNTKQFAIGFNNKSKYIELFGKNRTNSKLKLETNATNGDKFLFVIDWINKHIVLYHNENKVGIIFKNISNFIIPAVSGRGAQYTIHIVTDISIITKQESKVSKRWSFWG